MNLNDEQIRDLLNWFNTESETRKSMSGGRKEALIENSKWIQPDIINTLPDDELEKKYIEYYNSGGGKQALNRINRDKIIRNKQKFREMVSYLLDENIDIGTRLTDVVEGKYHIDGVGKGLATSFLMDFNPKKYCIWNEKTEKGLSVIGWDPYSKKDSLGDKYSNILKALYKLRDMAPGLNMELVDIDLLLHTISSENDGIEAVKRISGVKSLKFGREMEANTSILLLSNKSQIILYGPPGTGKTYNARIIAVKFIGEVD
ncbi:MAG: hypothetical protein FIB08_06995 [Candidatus Methanoperedens sp.]|nr:hypothetical protein [Candidatus Methanoperedens sp.]